ncbi:MAG: hypothetical protein ABIG10_01505 [bacterium]
MFENRQPAQPGQGNVQSAQIFPQVPVPGTNKSAEDIFADVERPPAGLARETQQMQPPARPGPRQPLSIEPPMKTGGTLKYLVLGIITLIVVLVAGVFIYQKVLKPRFEQANEINDTSADITEQDEFYIQDIEIDEFEEEAELGDDLMEEEELSTIAEEPEDTADYDGDGLTDEQEAELGTNRFLVDSDDDGLSDKEEIEFYNTNPLDPDTDGDTYLDGQEVRGGYNPNGSGNLSIEN